MGVLTEQLTQLRNEILDLRSARQGLAQTLERETEERRADVSQTLADFSKKLRRPGQEDESRSLGLPLGPQAHGQRPPHGGPHGPQRHSASMACLRCSSARGGGEIREAKPCRKRKPTWKEARAKQAARHRS